MSADSTLVSRIFKFAASVDKVSIADSASLRFRSTKESTVSTGSIFEGASWEDKTAGVTSEGAASTTVIAEVATRLIGGSDSTG